MAGSDPAPAHDLPHLRGEPFVTDGGMETDLIFHHGVDLPHFAAYLLLEDDPGRALLTSYYDGYAAIALRDRSCSERTRFAGSNSFNLRCGTGP